MTNDSMNEDFDLQTSRHPLSHLDEDNGSPEEPEEQRLSNKQKLKKYLGVWFVFLGFFFLFLYISFPYDVLKEAVLSQVNRQTNIQIQIDELRPAFPIAVKVNGIRIQGDTANAKIQLDYAKVGIALLPLFIGQIKPYIYVSNGKRGSVDLQASVGLFQTLVGRPRLKSFYATFNSFEIDSLILFVFEQLKSQPNQNIMIKEFLSQVGFVGQLEGEISAYLKPDNPQSSSVNLDLALKDGKLTFDSRELDLAPQQFERFVLKANADQGKIIVQPETQIKSSELLVEIGGNIVLVPEVMNSSLELNSSVEMTGELAKRLGVIVDIGLGGRNGKAKTQYRGTLAAPRMIPN